MRESYRYNTIYKVRTKSCGWCGRRFHTSYKWTSYCSPVCRTKGAEKAEFRKKEADNRRRKIRNPEREKQLKEARARYRERIAENPGLKQELLRRQRIRDKGRAKTSKRKEQVRLAVQRLRARKRAEQQM